MFTCQILTYIIVNVKILTTFVVNNGRTVRPQ
ncbi:hypothetical protein SMNI109538_03865 [Smaragdicoccus niigatensis]